MPNIERLQNKANKLSNQIEIAIGEDNMKNVNKLIELEIEIESYCNQ